MPAEVVPCPLADGAEACHVWRKEALASFQARIRELGLEDDPQVLSMFRDMRINDEKVDELERRQEEDASSRPWWADGEYDSEKADRANDMGIEDFQAGEFSQAFDHFTEAIRLGSSRAVYHCNRASAALRLKRHDIAAADVECALERDPKYYKAMMKGAEANLGLRSPEKALQLYRQALALKPASKAALSGVKEAAEAVQQLAQDEAEVKADALKGKRRGISQKLMQEEVAAELLYSAREVLQANPHLESARCAEVEALIHCQRFDDALEGIAQLQPGCDKLYLQAEALWRQGDLAGATDSLEEALLLNSECQKCVSLKAMVSKLKSSLNSANTELEDGSHTAASIYASDVLEWCAEYGCRGLKGKVLCLCGRIAIDNREKSDARQHLEAALMHCPESVDVRRERSRLFTACGQHNEAFFELQHVQTLKPDDPDIFEEVKKAATMCLRFRGRDISQSQGAEEVMIETGPGYYKTLGVSTAASSKELRSAYHVLAGKWHPDKWQTAADQEKLESERIFRKVKEAYDTLSDDALRFAYDSKHLRSKY